MNVGVCKLTLRLPENQDLKGKRRVISSLSSRIRNKFNVSIAEVGDNDSWQSAVLGITCVSNSLKHSDEVLNHIVDYIESSREDLEIVEFELDTLTGF